MSDFYHYLMAQRGREDPVGDLARDASRDDDFPQLLQSYSQLQMYLRSRGASTGALDAAEEAWGEWYGE